MIALGIVYGLLTAAAHAVAFAISRRFILQRHGNSLRLMVISHTLMGPPAAVLLVFFWSDELWDAGRWGPEMLLAAGTYLLGQAGLFVALKQTASSRIVPLLGLKVAAVAPAAVLLLGTKLGPAQYAAIALSLAAAFLLHRVGGRLPRLSLVATLLSVVMFALSDVYIVRLLPLLGGGFPAAARGVCLFYTCCGLAALALLPWFGSSTPADWIAAVPYAALWLPSMFLLFLSLEICGPVLFNIVLGTRGLIAIALGVLLSSRGLLHLEQHVSRGVVLRRTAAAVLMIAAIAIYGWS